MLTQGDFLSLTDILDFAASLNIDVYPEVRTSQDGIVFGAWQKYVAGAYTGMVFDARMQLKTYDPTVQAILSGFTFAVDVPDRNDHYVNQAIAAGGTTINFTPEQIELIKSYRDKLVAETGHKYSLSETVMYLLNHTS